MLDRYKKKGGFVQLLTLIETSNKQKQDNFLNLIAQESPLWEQAIRQKILTLDRVLSWSPTSLAEIFSRIQPLTLATSLHGMPTEKVSQILSFLSQSEQRKLQHEISERNPTPAEVATCVMKIITEVRGFSMGGVIKLDKVDPELFIPENIEEKIANGEFATSVAATTSPSPDKKAAEDSDPEPNLVFSNVKFEGESNSANREEVDFLKRRVNQLIQENATIKQELNQAKNKLEQIKKIA